MTTDIKKYDFKKGLPQEFEIVDLAVLYKKHKSTLNTNTQSRLLSHYLVKKWKPNNSFG